MSTFTRPQRLQRMRLPLLVYQKSGLQRWYANWVAEIAAEENTGYGTLLQLRRREAVAEVTPA